MYGGSNGRQNNWIEPSRVGEKVSEPWILPSLLIPGFVGRSLRKVGCCVPMQSVIHEIIGEESLCEEGYCFEING